MLEIQEFIKNNPNNWETLLKCFPYNLTIKRDEDLILFKYHQGDSDFSLPIVQESRGLILEDSSFRVVRMGFKKFFNFGEMFAAKIDWKSARVQTKVDGSYIGIYYYNGKWRIGTNGMINAFEVPAVSPRVEEELKATTFGDLFMKCANNQGLDFSKLNKNYTYSFELTTPENLQVVKYNKRMIWHIGTRNNITLEELDVDIGIQKPEEWNFQTFDDVVRTASTFKDEQEGFVVVDSSWNRVKVKSAYYVAASHYFNDSLALRKLIAIFLSGDYDEFVSYFPKYAPIFAEMDNFVAKRVKEVQKDAKYWSKKLKSGQNLPIKSAFYLEVKNCYSCNYLSKLYDFVAGKITEICTPKEFVMADIHLQRDIKQHLRECGVTEDVETFQG